MFWGEQEKIVATCGAPLGTGAVLTGLVADIKIVFGFFQFHKEDY